MQEAKPYEMFSFPIQIGNMIVITHHHARTLALTPNDAGRERFGSRTMPDEMIERIHIP